MLDFDARTTGDRWIKSLDSQVALPAEIANEKIARSLTMPDDRRRFARLLCRGAHHRAALKYAATFPALPRAVGWYGVYTLDISRGGCGFLHSEPLFPGERMEILLLGGARHWIEITRCERWQERCFVVGAQFVEIGPVDDRATRTGGGALLEMPGPEIGEPC
jgi:hypothetical protein